MIACTRAQLITALGQHGSQVDAAAFLGFASRQSMEDRLEVEQIHTRTVRGVRFVIVGRPTPIFADVDGAA